VSSIIKAESSSTCFPLGDALALFGVISLSGERDDAMVSNGCFFEVVLTAKKNCHKNLSPPVFPKPESKKNGWIKIIHHSSIAIPFSISSWC
jgi:hypothetical protein